MNATIQVATTAAAAKAAIAVQAAAARDARVATNPPGSIAAHGGHKH